MLNFKKISLVVIILMSNLVLADSIDPLGTPIAVTVPNTANSWDFVGQVLYLRPGYVGNEFLGIIENSSDTVGTYEKIPANWSWGYRLEGSHHFGFGNDIDINWYHLNSTNVVSYAGILSFTSTGYTIGTPNVTAKPRWDAVNLELGQHVDFGDNYNVRFHGGLAFVNIHDSLQIIAEIPVDPLSPVYQKITYNFMAVGVRAGADLSYVWVHGISLYANTALAMFAGSKTYLYTSSPTPPNTTSNYKAVASASGVVPTLEGKLGAKYTYPLARGSISIDGGWMWINYFQPIAILSSDFSLQGAYFGLKWLGNFM